MLSFYSIHPTEFYCEFKKNQVLNETYYLLSDNFLCAVFYDISHTFLVPCKKHIYIKSPHIMYSHQKKSAQPYSTLIHNMPHHEETFEGYEYPIMMRNTQQYSEIQFDTYK